MIRRSEPRHSDGRRGRRISNSPSAARLADPPLNLTLSRASVTAGPASDVCMPYGSDGALRCKSSVIGAPLKVTKSVGSIELRRFFSSTIAISPSARYDFTNAVTQIDVPIYFLTNRSGLVGGVRA